MPRLFDAPVVRALLRGDDDRARALYRGAALRSLPEEVNALPAGVMLRPRRQALSVGELSARLRSWEQIDRAYEPTSEPIDVFVFAWLDVTGLCLDWGDDHVFVAPDGAIFGVPGDAWDELASAWARTRGFAPPIIALDLRGWREALGEDALDLHARARDVLD